MRISDWSSDVCSSDLSILSLLDHGNTRRKQDERQRHGATARRCVVAHRPGPDPRGKRYVASPADRAPVARAGQREAAHDLWQHRCRGTARSHARPPVPTRSETPRLKSGSESWRAQVWQYVYTSVVPGSLKKK